MNCPEYLDLGGVSSAFYMHQPVAVAIGTLDLKGLDQLSIRQKCALEISSEDLFRALCQMLYFEPGQDFQYSAGVTGRAGRQG